MSASHADQPTQAVSYPQLIDLLRRIFVAHGTSPEVADVLAENCAGAHATVRTVMASFAFPAICPRWPAVG